MSFACLFFCSSRRRHSRCALVTEFRRVLFRSSPIPQVWKDKLLDIDDDEVLLHRFSPTGFYSSAVRTPFLRNLEARSERQIPFSTQEAGDHTFQLDVGVQGTHVWVTRDRKSGV